MGPWKCGWAEKGRGQDVSGQGTARAVAMHYLLGMKTLTVADGVFWVKGRGWGMKTEPPSVWREHPDMSPSSRGWQHTPARVWVATAFSY